nr:MAG TPA: hypothetical protein [Caudoviricetes sp.]
MANSKVIFYGETLIDLTQDTVEADALLAGYTAHDKNGETITGTLALFAAISVTYPAGSVCTCTKGTKSYKAKNTSGLALFAVPEVGDWTVSCTDGTQTASTTVTVTADGEAVNVKLAYDLRLFDNGDECAGVTGGWTNAGYTYSSMLPAPPEISDGRIQLYGKSGGNTGIGTAQSIDLAGYSKLVIDRDVLSTNSTNSAGQLWLLPGKNVVNSQAKATLQFGRATGRAEQEIDVTNINTPVYVFASVGGSVQYKVDVYNIRLEK